jgi:hypothetical protein
MKHLLITLLGGAIASLITLSQAATCFAQTNDKESRDLRERDEFRQTFSLTPGALVEVSSIRGSVEVETANTEVAEVRILRSARSRVELEQFKVGVERKPQGLAIRGEQTMRDSGQGFTADVRHQVWLRLPMRVALSVRSVSGDVRVGNVGGQLTVNSVSGSMRAGAVDGQVLVSGVSGGVSIGETRGQVEIKSVSGNVSIEETNEAVDVTSVSGFVLAGVRKLGERGAHISSVSGEVELRFVSEPNAQLSVNNVSGELSIELPDVTVQSRTGRSAAQALIGKGGPLISINGVSRGVRLSLQGKRRAAENGDHLLRPRTAE